MLPDYSHTFLEGGVVKCKMQICAKKCLKKSVKLSRVFWGKTNLIVAMTKNFGKSFFFVILLPYLTFIDEKSSLVKNGIEQICFKIL